MKISKLHIDSFRHLENLDFDFTYPEDFHIEEKRGKPLDKICFIGQSATGKTGLLEFIFKSIDYILKCETIANKSIRGNNRDILSINGHIHLNIENEILKFYDSSIEFKSKKYEFLNLGGVVNQLISNKNSLLYFKSNLISDKNISILNQHPLELIEKFRDFKKNNKSDISIIFSEEIDDLLWYELLSEILEYRKKFNQKASELIGKGLISDIKKFNREIKKFHDENPNPIEKFALFFNPLVSKLNLKVDDVNTEFSIPIEDIRKEEIIPIQNTSTGTKGLLLSFLPLYKLETKDSIILIDEPERSLYPDMQMDLMEYYQNLAPEAQFIVATHSPFIAASFEPEERFILYFDEEGKVAVRRGSSPIGDDPNDMLENDFGINYINKFGQKKHEEYLELKQQLFFEKSETKKKKIAEKLEKLGEEYNF